MITRIEMDALEMVCSSLPRIAEALEAIGRSLARIADAQEQQKLNLKENKHER